MEINDHIYLYLDRDNAGIKATQQALNWSKKYKDHSAFYSQHKDLNDLLRHCQNPQQKKGLTGGRHF